MVRHVLRTAVVVLVLLAGAGCGDDDEPATTGTETSSPPDAPEPGGGTDGGCDDPGFTGQISREADDGHAAASITGDDVVDAIAYGFLGSSFTVYVADHEIDRATFEEFDQGDFSTDNAVTAPEGGVVATIFVSASPLEAGTTITYDDQVPSPIVDSGGGASAVTTNPSGTLTVTEVGDTALCFDIDYRDDRQVLQGTVRAEVWQGS